MDTSGNSMKTILYICETETEDTEQIVSFLKEDNIAVILRHSVKESLEDLQEGKYSYPVILMDTPSSLKDAEAVFSYLKENNDLIDRIPVLIVTDENHIEEDLDYMRGDAVDVVVKPVRKKVLLNRMHNIVEAYQSVKFSDFAKMLRALPANIYLKDAQGRYVFSSQIWRHLDTGGDPDWTIRGKTDLDIRRDKGNARLAMETDQRLMTSGKGASYIIQEKEDGILEYLQLIKEPLFNDAGKVMGIIALINNITEQELLKQKLENQSITDALTGVFNRVCFEKRIKDGFALSAYPVAAVTADCDNLKKINDTYGHLAGDNWICAGAEILEDRIRENGVLYRTGGDEFIAILTNTDEKEAEEIVRYIKEKASCMNFYGEPYSISLGYSVMTSHKENILDVLKKSDENMYQDKQKKKN